MRRRVFVTGIGLCSPLGNDAEQFFSRLLAGASGLKPSPELGLERLGPRAPAVGQVQIDLAGQFTGLQLATMDRASLLAVAASVQAVAQAGWGMADTCAPRTGLLFGSSAPGMQSMEAAYAQPAWQVADVDDARPLAIVAAMPHAPCAHIAQRHHIQGESITVSSACASSAIAIGEAYRRLQCGRLDRALAGGADCLLTRGMLRHWHAMRMLCTDPDGEPGTGCRPFSADRSGFALAEGAAVLALEAADDARDIRARSLGEVVGYGLSSDAQHMLRQGAQPMARAMWQAMADAGISPGEVGYINANGTGTWLGDAAETQAIHEVMAERAHETPVSATKSAHGHLMGAAGAVELVATLMALRMQMVPPTTFWTQRDALCDLDYVPRHGRPVSGLRYALSNSFGFGGSYACLAVRRVVR